MYTTVVMVFGCWQSAHAQDWRGIKPLHSSRADVERLLGAPHGECRCFYEFEGETIRIEYAKSLCVGYPSGWNVPADSVLTIDIRYNEPRNLSALRIVESEFLKAADDTLTTYYSNRERGVQYTISGHGKHIKTSYFPSSGNLHLRCDCFPSLDESTARSVYFDTFGEIPINDVLARLDNYVIQLHNIPRFKGYVIFYDGRKTSSKKMLRYEQSIKRHLLKNRGLQPDRLVIIDGGYREEATFELFMLTRELSPPEPRATRAPCRKRK
jgi:hypothetical protein